MPEVPLVCVGSAAGDRRRAHDHSLAALGVRARWVTWVDVLAGTVDWDAVLDLPVRPVIRLDAPSDDPAVDAALLALGGSPTTAPPGTRLLRHDHWHAGLAEALRRLDAQLAVAPEHDRMQSSDAVLTLFDKDATGRRLTAAGVPTPTTTRVATVADAMALLRKRPQSFVKVRYGSSAAGMMAVRQHRGRWHATTTVSQGHNAQPRTVDGEAAIASALEPIVAQDAIIQPWLPKLTLQGGAADFRVVVIGGRAQQVLPRIVTGHPFTNLHIGARRGDVAAARHHLGPVVWQDLLAIAEAAVAAFDLWYAGVDVLVSSTTLTPTVLEVNAFGDFHEGIEVEGRDTYRAELLDWRPRTPEVIA